MSFPCAIISVQPATSPQNPLTVKHSEGTNTIHKKFDETNFFTKTHTFLAVKHLHSHRTIPLSVEDTDHFGMLETWMSFDSQELDGLWSCCSSVLVVKSHDSNVFQFLLKSAACGGGSRQRANQFIYIHSDCEKRSDKDNNRFPDAPRRPWWPAELRLEGSNPNNPATEIKINAGRDLLPGGSSPRSIGQTGLGVARLGPTRLSHLL